MSKEKAIAAFGAVFMITVGIVGSDEGRIPLFQQTTITTPGHYIATRDITVGGGSAITIQASGVEIDLNGRTLSGSGGSLNLITINPGMTDVVIRNGRLIAAQRGISSSSAASVVRLKVASLEINNMAGSAIYVDNPEQVEVLNCTLNSTATSAILGEPAILLGTGGLFGGRIAGNSIAFSIEPGMRVTGMAGGEVVSNTLIRTGAALDNPGLVLFQGHGNLVEKNSIVDGSGIGLAILEEGDIIRSNRVTHNQEGGISVGGDSNLIEANVSRFNSGFDIAAGGISVSGAHNAIRNNEVSANIGYGISVSGTANIIEGNLSEGHVNAIYGDCGLFFADGNLHAYRNNMLRGNTGGGVCGAANTNAGGNIL